MTKGTYTRGHSYDYHPFGDRVLVVDRGQGIDAPLGAVLTLTTGAGPAKAIDRARCARLCELGGVLYCALPVGDDGSHVLELAVDGLRVACALGLLVTVTGRAAELVRMLVQTGSLGLPDGIATITLTPSRTGPGFEATS